MRPALPMIVTLSTAALVGTVALTSNATAFGRAERRAAELSGWQPAGPPVQCINIRNIKNTRVLSDRVIDFEMLGGKRYRNTLSYACPRLGFEERFSYRSASSQLCSIDTITVLEPGGHGLDSGAVCGLGEFQPINRVDAPAPDAAPR